MFKTNTYRFVWGEMVLLRGVQIGTPYKMLGTIFSDKCWCNPREKLWLGGGQCLGHLFQINENIYFWKIVNVISQR